MSRQLTEEEANALIAATPNKRSVYNWHKWLDGKDYIGVCVEYLRSPSGSDSWHSRKGYCSQKAVEGFIHEKESGQVARLVHYF